MDAAYYDHEGKEKVASFCCDNCGLPLSDDDLSYDPEKCPFCEAKLKSGEDSNEICNS